jgi:two-component system chemotaxis response regulator CheY
VRKKMANILIVDDSKFMRKILSAILSEEGHTIVGEAENGREATELYKRLRPDLVTLDIIMPDVEGTNALSALKEIVKEDPDARVMVVSAMGQEVVVEEYLRAGAKDFIVKPFQTSKIKDIVKSLMTVG